MIAVTAGTAPVDHPLAGPARTWFEHLRDLICADFERIEDELASGPHRDLPPGADVPGVERALRRKRVEAGLDRGLERGRRGGGRRAGGRGGAALSSVAAGDEREDGHGECG